MHPVTVFIERFRAAVSVHIGPCCPALLELYTRKCAYCCIIGQIKWWWWWWLWLGWESGVLWWACLLVYMSVCPCVSLSESISPELQVRTSPTFCACYLWPWLGLPLWRRSDMLCISAFMDDVIFAHEPRFLDVAAQLKRRARAAMGLAIISAQ